MHVAGRLQDVLAVARWPIAATAVIVSPRAGAGAVVDSWMSLLMHD
jgi:hypothetical protein